MNQLSTSRRRIGRRKRLLPATPALEIRSSSSCHLHVSSFETGKAGLWWLHPVWRQKVYTDSIKEAAAAMLVTPLTAEWSPAKIFTFLIEFFKSKSKSDCVALHFSLPNNLIEKGTVKWLIYCITVLKYRIKQETRWRYETDYSYFRIVTYEYLKTFPILI